MFLCKCQELLQLSRWVYKTTAGHSHNGILLGHKQKKKILPFATVLTDLENIMLSEITHQRKTNTILFHSYVEPNEQTELTRLIDAKQGDS